MIPSPNVQERPSQMSDGIPLCGRSGKPLSDKALVLALAQAVSESVPRDLRICARCIESFERWYWKRAKSTASSAANVQCANVTAPGIVSISRRSRHPRRKKEKRALPQNLWVRKGGAGSAPTRQEGRLEFTSKKGSFPSLDFKYDKRRPPNASHPAEKPGES
jgi:hypothetical protein